MNRAQKREQVAALTARLERARSIYLTDFRGLNVRKMTELRRRLRSAGVEYVVVKNRLARLALGAASIGGLEGHFAGPTGLVLSGADPTAAARVLAEFAREFERPTVRAGLVEGREVGPEQVRRLAQLPPREQLLAELAGTLSAPVAAFAAALTGLLTTFASAVEALRTQREGAA